MYHNTFLYLFFGALACTVGAVPLGLVNLSVVEAAVTSNIRKSMLVALGAAIIEILFALIALLAGPFIMSFFNGNIWIKIFSLGILLSAGVFFWFKRNDDIPGRMKRNSHGFLKGAILNLISIQVLFFWVAAVSILSVRINLPESTGQFFFFITGVWIAKMAVLHFYAILGKKALEKSRTISQNINRIIAVVLMVIAVIQILKF